MPLGVTPEHEPMAAVAEVQVLAPGQVLPPVPRHPSRHSCVASSHTRPLAGSPQSVSAEQPQLPLVPHTFERHTSALSTHVPEPTG
jgi:hypothetical protein